MFIRFKGYDKHGRYVFYQNAAELNPDAEKLEDQFRIYFIMQDSIMHDLDQSSVTGFAGENVTCDCWHWWLNNPIN